MQKGKPFYITTTLPYVNDRPHIGHALEFVQADILARYRRLMGGEVFFNTGTDEHGQKIWQKAREEGRDVQEYVDHFAGEFKKLRDTLGLSYDAFVRTTDPHHVVAAQALWKRCAEVGDIYKKKYKGLYCVGDEAFIKEADLVEGKCPNHPTMSPVEIEEENYFFRLSNYQGRLIEYLSEKGVIVPEWRREEALRFVQAGLEDFSISRIKEKMSWGIPVPDDDTQVMYVWFDALTNYISTLGWPNDAEGNFQKFWVEGETLQLAGKDQVRFQSIMWQAMLMSADIKTTDSVLYHGFVTSRGQKMSKSIGNVIDPLTIVAEYGTDALRYYLARHIHPFEDSDLTMEKFKEAYNADLANGLGNLTRRILTLARSHQVKLEYHEKKSFLELISSSDKYYQAINNYLNAFRYDLALQKIWNIDAEFPSSTVVGWMDVFIQQHKPFETIKSDPVKAKRDIQILLRDLWHVAVLLEPFIPDVSSKIKSAIEEKDPVPMLFPRKE